jgi:hypothetical protein
MGHLIEEYAKNLGVKISKPVFLTHYIPIVDDKYITIHIDNKFDSRYYEFFPEVIELLRNIFRPFGYKIYQIGGADDIQLPLIDKAFFGLSRKQTSYISKNASLHLGIDSFPVHQSSIFDIPIVALYSNVNVKNSKPYWSSPQKIRLLESDKNGNRPSYSPVEKPKSINTIKPEEVVKNVCELLNIPYTKSINTKFIGEQYSQAVVEIIPNFYGFAEELKNRLINIRMDYFHNENNLLAWCSNYACHIIANKQVSIKALSECKNNIKKITFQIQNTKDFPKEYLEAVKNLGLDISCSTKNKEELAEIRNFYFDFRIELDEPPNQDSVNQLSQISNLKFLTKKDIFSNGKRYASKAHVDSDKVFVDRASDVIYNESFWTDLDHYFIYES